MKLCLVASSGGHLFQLFKLQEAWASYDHFWVTFPHVDAKTLLEKERVFWAYSPTNRNLKNLFKNLWLAWRVLRREKPQVIISTGAAVAVPFLWIGRLLGLRTIYVESVTCIKKLSLSGRLVFPFVDRCYVQWPDLAARYPKTVYAGQVL